MTNSPAHGFLGAIRRFGRGINVLRLLIINVVFFGILLLLLGLLFRPVPKLSRDTVLLLKPDGMLVEQYSADPAARALRRLSGQPPDQVRVRDLVAAIDHAAHDPDITRILLDPAHLHFGGMGALEEIGAALDRFRASGKPVTAWAAHLDQMQYLLAAHADKIYLDPAGSVTISGLSNYRSYVKDLLDKLGVSVHLFRVGKYKSAAEPLILDGPSPAALEADKYWMGGLWHTWLTEVGRLRHIDPAKLDQEIDSLPAEVPAFHGNLAQLALKFHWIDGLATRAQIVQRMQQHGMATDHGTGFRAVDLAHYLPHTHRSAAGKPEVAVVVAEGTIAPGRQPPGSIGGESTAALIRHARADHNVHAIVLRVDSPGGEAFAAEQIRREVVLARKAGKPVIVSMGDMAASGGYWISMNANRIFAEPDTITGSIGIFGLYFTASKGLAKLGINTAGTGTTPLAGAFDLRRPFNPTLHAMVQSTVEEGYREFVGKVAKARGQSYADIDAIAQGRVWTGAQALPRGLIDQLGGLHDAIRYAARAAKLGDTYAVHYAQPAATPWQRFFLGLSRSASARMLTALGLHLPQSWFAAVARLSPALKLLQHTQPGKLAEYAYCFCAIH